jgi:branched-chain amino acid aminotransferase
MRDSSSVWFNYNGEFYRAGSAVLTTSQRGFRYGDGLFETLLVQNGRIRLQEYHFDRLFAGVGFLGFEPTASFARESLVQQVLDLCEKNGHPVLSRVRLMVFRGEGNLFDTAVNYPQYVIESSSLSADQVVFNEAGLRVGIYPEGRKACDPLANLKSNNFLLYVLAARYARDHHLDDCLVLNSRERIADSCIANLFYIKQGTVYTPPLSEGCVAGVMRRFLLDRMAVWGLTVREQVVAPEDLQNADEIFLTNALKAIRWVGEIPGRHFEARVTRELYNMVHNEFQVG